jgi:hypothetical protein
MIRIMMFSNSTGAFVTNFTVKGANSKKYFSRTTCERVNAETAAPSRCCCRKSV